ncbi:hypothetical protein AUK10_00610 [Candidatus Gracilibacteria bacterium CG2_30_37_12]|nr:MAG: hypothetical protein AUK10_00610 [Candidatus Gracilibacteria bacterium CG2_30_37_12]
MNDFFTDLDTDLHGTKKTPYISQNIEKPIQKPSPVRIEKNISIQKSLVERKIESRPSQNSLSTREKSPVTGNNRIQEVREQMMEAGVVVIVFKVDEKTKALLGHLKLETRGFVYPDEVREIHKMVIKKARASYEDTVKDIPDIEEKDLLKIIRRDLELFLVAKIERNPMIIPIIIYV